MATEVRVRQLLLTIAREIDAIDGATITAECTETPNNYRATANLIRAFASSIMTKLTSYRMTDGKSATRVNVQHLLDLADDYDKKATRRTSSVVVPGKFAVTDTGEDTTEFEDEN